jgi:hypothetical protein
VVKKFVVCMGKNKTNEERRLEGEGGSDLSIQMLQDVLYEQPLHIKYEKCCTP